MPIFGRQLELLAEILAVTSNAGQKAMASFVVNKPYQLLQTLEYPPYGSDE
jgi:hypothetical protein